MRYAVLLLSSVLIGGTLAVAQTAPSASAASKSTTATQPAIASTSAPPAHPMTRAQAEEMLRLTHADKLKNQMMESMMAQLRQIFPPYTPKDVITDMLASMEKADLDDSIIPIYQKYLSQKDAAAIIAFYKTPAGQHMLSTMPEVLRESQQAGAQLGEKVAREVIERHMAEIQAAAKKYKEEHSSSTSNSPQ